MPTSSSRHLPLPGTRFYEPCSAQRCKQPRHRITFIFFANDFFSPLFTQSLYENLGVQWGSSVPAFLSLGCAPIPFLFAWGLGKWLRDRSKFATEARRIMDHILEQKSQASEDDAEKQEARVVTDSLSDNREDISI